ncbi:acyl-CoA ligase (AMP-forming), exosortase A system-associated [Motiliproteus coralliicola]|uniref:Acyl-CoA ligase (AMP-forming), exosortase A system-associated n=1 Tax=Motiliproteus coralliicola TaxID=2283196 RepID=A0A369WZ85_9GAMM|nr:acyl-CoA ligase (AMP-forming), exosortase A system-associated [Motiliproteus coralliicola]RDE24825.1 acyl-CoA ligase (AMP-forming), exosortase A system-associated [Motiliproteus coralliicola]
MYFLFHHLLAQQARLRPDGEALVHKQQTLSYAQLWQQTEQIAQALLAQDLQRNERVAVYLPKQPETVVSLFAASAAGGCFVPVNPVLKAPQVGHILADCNARVLITNRARAQQLLPQLQHCHDLRLMVLVDEGELEQPQALPFSVLNWPALLDTDTKPAAYPSATDSDLAAILYTSGSTGKPKGVVLSHRNLVVGAQSVASYIGNHEQDRILAVLPLSFDAGLSQITTAFASGACCILLDYLLPNDVMKQVVKHRVTGITAVPPLWHQIANLKWTEETAASIRYFANTGGHMPQSLLDKLRATFSNAEPFLMYGLTEAFRSTYLPPEDVDRKPGSIGKAIPNAEVMILRQDGSECEANEIGELVHRGPLVSQGYWNDPARTAERFKPIPRPAGAVFEDIAVWSGDSAKRDDEGYLYFVGRQDEMIKTSGYRVSPSEIEEVAYSSGLVEDAVALGLPHQTLGQGILVLFSPQPDSDNPCAELAKRYRSELPNFMHPQAIIEIDGPLPRNPNGKFDRKQLAERYADQFDHG